MWNMDEWTGCYPSKWKGMVVPESISHPAKFSSRLIRRIYEHMIGEGWLHEGDRVVDPFGGVGLGALDAMKHGLIWTGMELEAKFSDLGNQNIAHWNARFGQMPRWGSAVLLNGDSRKMLEIIKSGRAAISSPPYAETQTTAGNVGNETGKRWKQGKALVDHSKDGYGSTDGQLGAMKADGFDVAVSSPPYADSVNQGDGANDPGARLDRKARAGVDNSMAVTRGGPNSVLNQAQAYGAADGQLGAMKADGFDAAISSPPFEQRSADGGWQMLGKYAEEGKLTVKQVKGNGSKHYPSWDKARDTSYGESDGQLSNMDSGGFDAAILSPPFLQAQDGGGIARSVRGDSDYPLSPGLERTKKASSSAHGFGYQNQGESYGNLENMADGDFQAAISSPPFRQSEGGTGAQGGKIDNALMRRHAAGNSAAEGYGGTEGQLANMGEGSFESAVSSPPYEKTTITENFNFFSHGKGTLAKELRNNGGDAYGQTDGQLGADTSDDFWLAARQIVEQVYMVLEPGGHAVWVCKDFVKSKNIVPFSDQWRQLCEAVGFVTLHEHHAMLVHASQYTLEGGVKHNESKSFFRRLAEKKGSPRIDFETVWCMVRP